MTSYCVFETRFGWAGIAGTDRRPSRILLPRESREEALRSVGAGFEIPPQQNGGRPKQEGAGLPPNAVEDEDAFGDLPCKLRDYFEGHQIDLRDTPVDLDDLPPFARKALLECKRVPYGTVVTYAEIARRVGSEKACRAVGNAMASNPVPIIVPCHRVLASNGKLGGFSAGLDWKRRLLELEGIEV